MPIHFFFQILIFIFMMKYFIWMDLYDRIQQSHDIQLYMYGCVSLLRHPVIPTAHYSDDPLFRQPIIPTAHYFDGPFFRQCKIELNPQIHGLARCIQQNGPSVRLILTDHGLFYYWRPSSILNSPRFHAYCYLPSFCLSHAPTGSHFFHSLLFSGSFVQCAHLFLQFLTFPIPGQSIIIALIGDVR
jgi:hypothetical protein